MTPEQYKALREYIDAAIDEAIDSHAQSYHSDDGVWFGETPQTRKYKAEDKLDQLFGKSE